MNSCGILFSHADSVAVHSNYFLLFEWLFAAKILPKDDAVTQNYDVGALQSEATKNKSHDWLIKHVEETMIMKNIKQFRTDFQQRVIYVWLYDWDL